MCICHRLRCAAPAAPSMKARLLLPSVQIALVDLLTTMLVTAATGGLGAQSPLHPPRQARAAPQPRRLSVRQIDPINGRMPASSVAAASSSGNLAGATAATASYQVLASMQQLPERYRGLLLDQFGVSQQLAPRQGEQACRLRLASTCAQACAATCPCSSAAPTLPAFRCCMMGRSLTQGPSRRLNSWLPEAVS